MVFSEIISKIQFQSFLRELGLSESQIEIYHLFFGEKSLTTSEVAEKINLSYSQTLINLKKLERLGLITPVNTKPKFFHLTDPAISLPELIEQKNDNYRAHLEYIQKEFKRQNSSTGLCTKQLSHFYYSDIGLGVERLHQLISFAKSRIILSSLPIHFMKKIKPALKRAFLRGVNIEIFFSRLDYDQNRLNFNLLDYITDIFKDVGCLLIEIQEKTCQTIGFNNQAIQNGFILIDEGFFNTVGFSEDNIYFLQGFYSKMTVTQIYSMFQSKNQIKKLELNLPEKYQKLLDILKNQSRPLKTREISKLLGVSGIVLKDMLQFLVNKGAIKEKISQSSRGRPAVLYSV